MSEDPRCMGCGFKKSYHKPISGNLLCPPVDRYFTPCTHINRTGFGSISSDGKSSGESYCQNCGERFTW